MSDVLANLDSSDRDRLARALGVKQADDPTFQQRLQALGAMALEEWVDWILSRRRPSTVSSLELERLIVIFAHLRRQAPTVQGLVEEFDIHESRAKSLLSRMQYGIAGSIRALQLKEAIAELERRLLEAAEQDGRKEVEVKEVEVSPDTSRHIDWANARVRLRQTSSAGTRAVRMVAGRHLHVWKAESATWELILKELRDEAGRYSKEGGD